MRRVIIATTLTRAPARNTMVASLFLKYDDGESQEISTVNVIFDITSRFVSQILMLLDTSSTGMSGLKKNDQI
jgi:hypothetical protein